MSNSNRICRGLVLLPLIIILFSCSKEEEEVKLVEYTTPSFDNGHLKIKLLTDPGYVDSIKYSNITKGVTSTINKSGFAYDQLNNLSILSLPILSGNSNDQVECCVYLNSSVNIGIVFENIHIDSIDIVFTGSNVYCNTGTY